MTNSAIPSKSANSIATLKICEAFAQLNNDVMLITRNSNSNRNSSSSNSNSVVQYHII